MANANGNGPHGGHDHARHGRGRFRGPAGAARAHQRHVLARGGGARNPVRARHHRIRDADDGRVQRQGGVGLLRRDVRVPAHHRAGGAHGRNRAAHSQGALAAAVLARRRAVVAGGTVQPAAVHPHAVAAAEPGGQTAHAVVLPPRRGARLLAARMGDAGADRAGGRRRGAGVGVVAARPGADPRQGQRMASADGAQAVGALDRHVRAVEHAVPPASAYWARSTS